MMHKLQVFVALLALAVAGIAASPATRAEAASTPQDVDRSQRHLNESEGAIVVNPTNPNNIVVFTNVGHQEAGLSAGMFLAVSFDSGSTWATRLVAHSEIRADSAVRARDVAVRRAKADGARTVVVLRVSAADPWRQHNLDYDRLNRYLVAVEETFSPR